MKNVSWKEFLLICVFLVLTSSILHAAEKTQNNPSNSLPIEKVTEYLGERSGSTTYQTQKAEKELVGKQFNGIVIVWDVLEVEQTGDLILEAMQKGHGRGAELRFLIEADNMKEKAGLLRRSELINITATLDSFTNDPSGYINVSDTYEARFKDVQEITVQSKDN